MLGKYFTWIVKCLEVHGKCLDFSLLLGTSEPRSGLVDLCFWITSDTWEILMPRVVLGTSSGDSSLLLSHPEVNVLREEPHSTGLQAVF